MALNFPSNPTLNQEYSSGNSTWKWDGTAWNIIFGAGQTEITAFRTISVAGQPSVVAESSADALTLVAGNDITITTNPETDSITINSILGKTGNAPLFRVAADDSSSAVINLDETIKFIGGTGVTTTVDAEGNVTINSNAQSATFSGLSDSQSAVLTIDKIYEPAIAMLRMDNSGATAYTVASHYAGNNPTIFVLAGTTIAFDLTAIPGHPFVIQDPLGDPYNTGLVHVSTTGVVSTGAAAQGKDSGTLYWRIPESISGGYRYQCQVHPAMVGAITIKRLSVI